MNEEELKSELCLSRQREDRYRWSISIGLVVASLVVGFLAGMITQTERLRDQVVTNTATIRTIERGIVDINQKLDRALEAR